MFVYKHNKKRGKMSNVFNLEKNIYFEFGFYFFETKTLKIFQNECLKSDIKGQQYNLFLFLNNGHSV